MSFVGNNGNARLVVYKVISALSGGRNACIETEVEGQVPWKVYFFKLSALRLRVEDHDRHSAQREIRELFMANKPLLYIGAGILFLIGLCFVGIRRFECDWLHLRQRKLQTG